jgi:hypothetical protein
MHWPGVRVASCVQDGGAERLANGGSANWRVNHEMERAGNSRADFRDCPSR